jgi:hypothetical protein
MVKNIALAALVGLFATATLAEGEGKKDETINNPSDAGKDEKKPEEKKDEKHEEKK